MNCSHLSRGSVLLWACLLLAGCAKPEQPTPPAEQPPPKPVESAPEEPKPSDPRDDSAPQPGEAQAKAEQIFKGAVRLDTVRRTYSFVGDFNGDLSQDLALIVKPVRDKLGDLNHEFAPWIRNDALTGVLPESVVRTESLPTPRPVQVADDNVLLAMIHGYGTAGWRNKDAQQTYLVKNAIGGDMRAGRRDEVQPANKSQKLPRLRGDVIYGTLAGEAGFLYYNGAYYTWYDPKRYKPEPPRRMVH